MKTSVEQSRDRERQAGYAEGRLQRRAEALLQLVQLRFGGVPAEVTIAIATASLDQLDRWLESAMTTRSAEELVNRA